MISRYAFHRLSFLLAGFDRFAQWVRVAKLKRKIGNLHSIRSQQQCLIEYFFQHLEFKHIFKKGYVNFDQVNCRPLDHFREF